MEFAPCGGHHQREQIPWKVLLAHLQRSFSFHRYVEQMMQPAELLRVPGVPETAVAPEVLAQLPTEVPPAPWRCRGSAVLWLSRGGAAASAALPDGIRTRGLFAAGGFIRYTDTPVGSYDEVMGIVGFRDGFSLLGNVAFMAVDSLTSLAGGRTNWAMPKTVASFAGSPGDAMQASGDGWQVDATVRPFGPRLPLRMSMVAAQQWPDGQIRRALMRLRSSARLAVVDARVESDRELNGWLRPGKHLGLVTSNLEFTLSPAHPEA
ncbi:hypothetical protein D5S17_20435 [Pseudonocardiaceae bacterium YIM PH 21723]|nr:hypothetical protein D5S17_20435 [Pseudonocardiaceae bacterium YIM PH 21723]